MFRSYKYRLYATPEQEKILNSWLGQLRFVWNHFLNENQKEYGANKKFIWKYGLNNLLPDLKKQYQWISAPSQSLQHISENLDKALKKFCKNKTTIGFPKFKSKYGTPTGIHIPQQVGQIKTGKNFIKIPKLGEIKWVLHRPMKGVLKSITITRDVDQWYVSCLCEMPDSIGLEITNFDNEVTGIDLGIKTFIVDSDAVIYELPKNIQRKELRRKKYQRHLAKKKKGSKNQLKAKLKVARAYRKERRARADFHHKISSQIANENIAVVCEDLSVKNMVKNHCLAKAISEQGWSQFVEFLNYKLVFKGGELIKINRFFPSSQMCSNCSTRQKMSLDMRTYNCPTCGFSIDRDLNAARNIKEEGIRILFDRAGTVRINACGDTAILVSMNQEKSLGPISGSLEATRSV